MNERLNGAPMNILKQTQFDFKESGTPSLSDENNSHLINYSSPPRPQNILENRILQSLDSNSSIFNQSVPNKMNNKTVLQGMK